MARPRRNLPEQTAPPQPLNGQSPAAARSGAESELDEYIHLGEAPVEEEDLFADIPEEAEEDDTAPIPRIERDTKLEEEIEREKYVPIEKLIEDVPDLGQSLDPVRMYLSDIGRHPLLSADEENSLARRIHEGEQAEQRLKELGIEDVKPLLKLVEEKVKAERELADFTSVDPEEQGIYDEVREQLRLLNSTGRFDAARIGRFVQQFKPAKFSDHKSIAGPVRDVAEALQALAELGIDEPAKYLELARVNDGLEAHRRLAQSNLRLVVSVAKRYIGRGLNLLDLIQEGNLGLLRAVDKFDHTLGYKFSTYATWWIRQAISRAIADQARTIRIPVHMVETINRQARIQRRLQQELGREPTFEELALEMEFLEPDDADVVRAALANDRGMDLDLQRRLERASAKVRRIQRLSQEPLSLETPVGNEETSSLGDFIEDDSLPGPVDTASRRLLREQMNEILEGLNERERKVLMMRFGLEDGIPRTLEDVGKEFNVTRERVRQIEAKALRKLRHPLRSRKLRDYLA